MAVVFPAVPRGRLLLRAKIQAPGSRGGRGYFGDAGWRYGDRPKAGERLPEGHDRYFHQPPGTTHVPLDQLRPTDVRPDGVARAEGHMRRAHDGAGGKRAPLTIGPPDADGTHPILDGSSTYHVARQHGWSSLPTRPAADVHSDAFRETRDREHMQHCPTCRSRMQMDPAHAAALDAGMAKARLVVKGMFPKPTPPAGEHELGTTATGKTVHVSGANAADFDDDEHREAATLHRRAHRYHATAAAQHGAIATKPGQNWKVSEEHHREQARHTALAEHHVAAAQDHLIAGGHGGRVQLDVRGKTPVVSKLKPHTPQDRAAARRRLAARTHHQVPAAVMARDKAAYAALNPPAKDPRGRRDG